MRKYTKIIQKVKNQITYIFNYNCTPAPLRNFAFLSKANLGFAGKSKLSNRFFLNFSKPTIAIIAALSPHNLRSGNIDTKWFSSLTWISFFLIPLFAATPPATKKLLLDFYLINTNLSSKGNKVRATINDTVFIIDEWVSYYIEGLPKGEVSVKLELINSEGNLIQTPYNPSTRKIILK